MSRLPTYTPGDYSPWKKTLHYCLLHQPLVWTAHCMTELPSVHLDGHLPILDDHFVSNPDMLYKSGVSVCFGNRAFCWTLIVKRFCVKHHLWAYISVYCPGFPGGLEGSGEMSLPPIPGYNIIPLHFIRWATSVIGSPTNSHGCVSSLILLKFLMSSIPLSFIGFWYLSFRFE